MKQFFSDAAINPPPSHKDDDDDDDEKSARKERDSIVLGAIEGKVKDEKGDRSEFRVALKAKKYADKERVENKAYGDGEEAGL